LRSKDDQFDLWFPLGILAGASLTWLLVLAPTNQGLAEWAESLQGLISAVIAVFAAVLTVWGTLRAARQEIQNAQSMDEERKAERFKASRAILPLAARELQSHVLNTINQIISLLETNVRVSDELTHENKIKRMRYFTGMIKSHPLPPYAMASLKEVVELAPLDVGREVAEAMMEFQRSTASFTHDENWFLYNGRLDYPEETLNDRLVEQIQLYARADRLICYVSSANDCITTGPVSLDEFTQARRRALGVSGRFIESLDERYRDKRQAVT